MKEIIRIQVEDIAGNRHDIEVPTGVNLSLMEVLKASDYPIAATCGGMALCATCHIEVTASKNGLPSPTDAEMDMLDTLPQVKAASRLSCQIKVDEKLDGLTIRLIG